jgi:hypothetical protein
MGLFLPRGFQKPPMGARINWSHPLARGLDLAFVFNEEGSSVATDLVQGRECTLYGPGAAMANGGLELGAAGGWASVGDYDAWDGSATWSAIVVVKRGATGTAHGLIGQWGSTIARLLHFDAGNTVYGLAYDGSSFAQAQSAALATDLAAITTAGITQSSATAMQVHFEGRQVASTTFGAVTARNTTDELMIGSTGSIGTPTNILLGTIYAAYVWPTRALTADEHAWLHAEPYAFLTR